VSDDVASDSDEDEEGDEVCEFVATGENSCERCAALDGTEWQSPPDPPHAHCECEVQPRRAGSHESGECGDNSWSIEHVSDGEGTVRYGSGLNAGSEWGFVVTIDCWDGAVYEFEVWVDMGSDDQYPGDVDEAGAAMEGYAWSEIYDEAEAVAAQVCKPCEEELVS
jgi:hypothetical protein